MHYLIGLLDAINYFVKEVRGEAIFVDFNYGKLKKKSSVICICGSTNMHSIDARSRELRDGGLTLIVTLAVTCTHVKKLFEVASFYVRYVLSSWDTVVPPPPTGLSYDNSY